jgi:ATP phosphoribosyltransferase
VSHFYGKDDMKLVVLEGAVEISVGLGVADAVVDVVETGTTLKQAGLRILGEPLFRSNAALFCHPDKQNLSEVHTLIRRIEGKLVAQAYMMIEYDVPESLLGRACELTPGLDAPTVSKLHGKDWYAVKAMVRQVRCQSNYGRLWDVGCRSILLLRLQSAPFKFFVLGSSLESC